MGREPAAEPPGDVLHERRVREDQAVADRLILRPPVLVPESSGLVALRRHGRRLRWASRFSSVAAERAARETCRPETQGGRGDRDDPAPRFAVRAPGRYHGEREEAA